MPIWLRNFTHKKMIEHYEEENRQYKQAQGKGGGSSRSLTTDGKVTAPEFMAGKSQPKSNAKSIPSYTTKASNK